MNERTKTVLKRIGLAALAAGGAALIVAIARTDVEAYYTEQNLKTPHGWTDANRWE